MCRASQSVSVLLLLSLLSACSVMGFGYERAPWLLHRLVDQSVDLRAEQTAILKPALEDLHQWHRETQLERYQTLLKQWQVLVLAEPSADAWCEAYQQARGLMRATNEKLVQGLSEFTASLSDEQHRAIEQERQKRREERDDEPPSSLIERAEQVYGELRTEQKAQLRPLFEPIEQDWDSEPVQREQQRRRQDFMNTLKQVQGLSAFQAQPVLLAYVDRVWQSPSDTFRERLAWREAASCRAVAKFHQSTSITQRAFAHKRLQRYVNTVNDLME